MSATARTLTSADIEAVARRVVELLGDDDSRLVDAQAVADALGIARTTVYERADELGARRLGDGPRARLRFSLAEAREAWAGRASATGSQTPDGPAPARPRAVSRAPLLPIRGQEAA